MANPRTLDKRRKSIRNIRKITRTMELIATARFKKAMDRATAATSYTDRITRLVGDLSQAGASVDHPLLEQRDSTENATLLVLTANRGLCGGYNGNVIRSALKRRDELLDEYDALRLELSGKRGIGAFKFRGITPQESYLQFDDQPKFDEVRPIADQYLEAFTQGKIDRLDVAYMRFVSAAKQEPVIETLLPMGSLEGSEASEEEPQGGESMYEFVPSAESILEEVVPTSFRVKLFKCFLDAAVSEQIARMVAMKAATENANDMIRQLSMAYNRARQGQITTEIMDIIGGVEALNN